MAVKKAGSTPRIRRTPANTANGKQPSYQDTIRQRLSIVPRVEAVYTWIDSHKVVHVVSVVRDQDRSKVYDRLIPQEELVEKEHSDVPFEFHVRARQKQTVDEMIPSSACLVFKK